MFERRTKAESWDQGGLVPRAVKHLEYLMTHYGEYDMEGGDKNEWVSISNTGARWPPYVVDPPPLQRGREDLERRESRVMM
ncbi:hypothetical protein GIB67_014323, partial [Kingdonia uniflora]